MTGLPVGIFLELVVAGLLAVTVGYCFVLNRRLKRLRYAQDDLRSVIRDLAAATQNAENAISGLKLTADDAERKLADKLHKARQLTQDLTKIVQAGRPQSTEDTEFDWRRAS